MDSFRFDKKTDELFSVILSLETVKEAEAFFRDLCTIDEIKVMCERFQIAKLVYKGMPYRDIAKKLKVSTTTVSRVAIWVFHGEGGYKSVLDKMPKGGFLKFLKRNK
jgi:TrpR-related protein YerC/YecD